MWWREGRRGRATSCWPRRHSQQGRSSAASSLARSSNPFHSIFTSLGLVRVQPNSEPQATQGRRANPELADPTKNRSSGEENNRIKYGASCKERACAHTAILELDGSDSTSFFGVFDGHGGDEVALYCSKQFHVELVKDPEYNNDLHIAVENVYFSIDENLKKSDEWRKSHSPSKKKFLRCLLTGLCVVNQLCKKPYIGPQEQGSTACVALIRGNKITIANVGDSRCVISRNGEATDLSTDHKPNHQGELQRIEAAGGRVLRNEIATIESGLFLDAESAVHRIDGKIAISRAIGYLSYKQNNDFCPAKQRVTCNPDIHTENITDDIDFLLIASNGIWNLKSSQQVVHFVQECLQSGQTDLCAICESLIDSCTESGDNLTVILVQFKSSSLFRSLPQAAAAASTSCGVATTTITEIENPTATASISGAGGTNTKTVIQMVKMHSHSDGQNALQ